MGDLAKRLAALTPEKRAILLERLKKKQEEKTQELIYPQKREANELPLSFSGSGISCKPSRNCHEASTTPGLSRRP